MKVYISGPITGKPNHNREAFAAAADLIRDGGDEPINPLDIPAIPGARWEDFMRSDIAAMMGCRAVFMLPGWQDSKGATIEHELAVALGFRVVYGGSMV